MAATSQNGIRHSSSRPPPPLGVVVPSRDPMLAVIDLDKKKAGVSTGMVFSTLAQATFVIIVGLVTNWGLLTWTHHMQAEVRARLRADYEIDLKEEEPPPPVEPPKEEEPEAKPQPVVQRIANTPPPPAAPAAAAAVLTAKDDDVVDMSNTIVNGNGPGNGGLSANNGQSNGPGGAATGSPTGTGTVPAPPPQPPPPPPVSTVDRSRNAKELSGNWSWCPFPAEADMAQIDEARVTMEVTLRADGTPAKARAISDPGNGFGRAAQQCAMRAKYNSALDHDGNPIPTTFTFRVTFSR